MAPQGPGSPSTAPRGTRVGGGEGGTLRAQHPLHHGELHHGAAGFGVQGAAPRPQEPSKNKNKNQGDGESQEQPLHRCWVLSTSGGAGWSQSRASGFAVHPSVCLSVRLSHTKIGTNSSISARSQQEPCRAWPLCAPLSPRSGGVLRDGTAGQTGPETSMFCGRHKPYKGRGEKNAFFLPLSFLL